jgi:hypothetical protein
VVQGFEQSPVKDLPLEGSSLACKYYTRVEVNYKENNLAFYDTAIITAVKSFILQDPEAKPINLLTT